MSKIENIYTAIDTGRERERERENLENGKEAWKEAQGTPDCFSAVSVLVVVLLLILIVRNSQYSTASDNETASCWRSRKKNASAFSSCKGFRPDTSAGLAGAQNANSKEGCILGCAFFHC